MTRVIVVDDEESIRTLLSRWLKAWEYDVWTAASADDALELMTTRPAEIVLCDVMMPIHDGIWLIQQIRKRWPATAVIMVTGAQDLETVMKLRQHGAVDYVCKPFGRESVRQALQRGAAAVAAAAPV